MSYGWKEDPQGQLNLEIQGPASILSLKSHLAFAGPAPAVAALTSAGTTATVSVVGNDQRGLLTWAPSGTGLAVGAQVLVTFANGFVGQPSVIHSEANASTAGANAYITASTNSFTLNLGIAPVAGTYSVFYQVMG